MSSAKRCRVACRDTPRAVRDAGPAAPAGAGDLHGLGQPRTVVGHRVRSGGHSTQIVGALHARGRGIQVVEQLLGPGRFVRTHRLIQET